MIAASSPRVLFLAGLLAFTACNSKKSGIAGDVSPLPSGFRFVDVHKSAGLDFRRALISVTGQSQAFAGGVAAGDYDQDGNTDLYVVGGHVAGNLLYRNKGDGSFEEVAQSAGVQLFGGNWSGATFADCNGDGRPDLLVCGVEGTLPCLLLNQGDGTFADATPGSGLDAVRTDTIGSSFADYDRDGDLDLFLTQWGAKHAAGKPSLHLWRNKGAAQFEDVSLSAGVTEALGGLTGFTDMSLTANFSDLDGDGWLDLCVTGDLGASKLLRNNHKGGFVALVGESADVPFASGAAIGDIDGDGDLDWFLSGAYRAGDTHQLGNRLLFNDGLGGLVDGTQGAGVMDGSIGWAASCADFDNSGSLDILQLNGYALDPNDPNLIDRSRLFINNGSAQFVDRAAEAGLEDFGQGRGLVCFDFDRDGDLDIFVLNALGEPRLWRNEGGNQRSWVTLRLTYVPGNLRGAGAQIRVTSQGRTQLRELRLGSNFQSQNPLEAHFGLGTADAVEAVEVRWPDGAVSRYGPYRANQLIQIRR